MAFTLPKIKKTVFDSIPIRNFYKHGIIETGEGTYTKAYKFDDINFKLEPDERQLEMFYAWGKFLNVFPDNFRFQVLIINHQEAEENIFDSIRFRMQNDSLNQFRLEKNMINAARLEGASRTLVQEKFLIVSIDDADIEHAFDLLSDFDSTVEREFKRISQDARVRACTTEERLHLLFTIYNQDGHNSFYNDKREDGRPFLNAAKLSPKMDPKLLIAPSGFKFDYRHFQVGMTYGCSMFLQKPGIKNDTNFISELCDNDTPIILSMSFEPVPFKKAVKNVENKMADIKGQISKAEREAGSKNYSSSLTTSDTYKTLRKVESLQDELKNNDQRFFRMTMTVCVFGSDEKELSRNIDRVISVGKAHDCTINVLLGLQEYGFNQTLPLCEMPLYVGIPYTTISVSAFLPFTSSEVNQSTGYVIGTNPVTKNPIRYDRRTGNNFNCLVFGNPGTGKSMLVKDEITNVLLNPDDNSQVIILDPQGEYKKLAKKFGGEVITVAPGSQQFINPLDLSLDRGDQDDPVAVKAEYIIAIFSMICGPRTVLTPEEEAIIDFCVQRSYEGYLEYLHSTGQDSDKEHAPTLNDVQQKLSDYNEAHGGAERLVQILSRYTSGSMSAFSQRTTVDTTSRVIDYDISKIGSGMKGLGLFVCLNDAWNLAMKNKKRGMWTRVYFDEAHLLFQSPGTAATIKNIWATGRKYNFMPTALTQRSSDLMRDNDTRAILDLTDFVIMMSSNENDRRNYKTLYRLSDAQLEYVRNAKPGHGLLYCNHITIPFNAEIPRYIGDQRIALYDIISTSGDKDKLFGAGEG